MKKKIIYAIVGIFSICSLCACTSNEISTQTQAPVNADDFLMDPLATTENTKDPSNSESSRLEDTTTTFNEQYVDNSGSTERTESSQISTTTKKPTTTNKEDVTTVKPTTTSSNKPTNTTTSESTTLSNTISINTYYPDKPLTDETTKSQSSGNETSTTAPVATSGTISGDVKWKVDGTTLTIYGFGKMSAKAPTSYKEIIESVIISDGVTEISTYAFNNYSKLKTVSIADTVTTIGSNAFYYCTSLETVHMSNNVTYIGSEAFRCCTALSYINLPATLKKPFEAHIFTDCYKLTIYGPADCDAYLQYSAKYPYVITE